VYLCPKGIYETIQASQGIVLLLPGFGGLGTDSHYGMDSCFLV
jgi:hypothetical protein